jgi:hypothetical protein
MLRREFLQAVAGFAAAAVAPIAAAASTKTRAEKAIQASEAPLPAEGRLKVTNFERVVMDFVRSGELRCLGVLVSRNGEYEATYIPTDPKGGVERYSHAALMRMYETGFVRLSRAVVINGGSGVELTFEVAT